MSYTLDVLVLYGFVLCLPQDGDLSLKHVGGFMYMDDLGLDINCVHLLVYIEDSSSSTSQMLKMRFAGNSDFNMICDMPTGTHPKCFENILL
jgi:hypothetical protein